ncbi:restriction endonuclease subunit S [Empedobacter falsenii]
MAKGNRIINEFEDNIWLDVFYNSVGTYVNVINKDLSELYTPEPLSNYIKIGGGFAFKTAQYKKEGIPIIRISDFNNEKIDLSNCVFYDEDDKLSKYELKENDIIICLTGGTIGKLGIVQAGLGKLYMNQRVGRFDVLDNSVFEKEYVYWIARSVQDTIKNLAWGAAIPNVSPKQIEQLEFSIPTIEIQRNIIQFLNDLKSNSIENKEYFNKEIEQHILKLHQSNINLKLADKEITHQLDLIKDLRQAFLREAMQGILVRNETQDVATGADLLAEIQAEKAQLVKEKKIKKPKTLAPITEDELPFDIPKNWTWCKVDDISIKIGSGSTPKGSNYSENGFPFFRSQNIKNEGLVFDDIKFVSDEVQNQMIGTQVLANDLLLNITGGSLGRCALVPNDFNEGNVSQHVCILRGLKVLPKFYHLLVLSPYFQKLIFSSTTGAGREGLPKYNLEQFIIPLPPLEIQERIVAKLDELMAVCDALETQVKQSKNTNEQLLQEVLREALGA